ncbi:Uncharacterised protein [Shigella sonnei]|nr:Uncharacterised protein [Shigella sonnei]CSP59107.1 Uncharacterised protein [Shigella sonnei]CSP73504.1 Uncharacterised protein [Shigella sonnei]CSP89369.1 Uncharacterised protein [Shigella sonnei]CSR74075.1 Uncharacterised protein [Shigella sonnei]
MHQIEVKATQPQPARQLCRAFRFLRAMNTPKSFQLFFAKTLHTNRDAVHTSTLIIDKAIGFYRSRVRFHSNFCIRCQRQTRTHAVQQRLHRRAGKQARRTTANKDCLYFTALSVSHIIVQIAKQMLNIIVVRHFSFQRVRVEIAVRAFLHAPRDVNVETQRR